LQTCWIRKASRVIDLLTMINRDLLALAISEARYRGQLKMKQCRSRYPPIQILLHMGMECGEMCENTVWIAKAYAQSAGLLICRKCS
jgi:hypothetical protein